MWGKQDLWGMPRTGGRSLVSGAPTPSIEYVGVGAFSSGVGALSPAAPAQAQQHGDILLLTAGNSLTNTVPSLSVAAGYTAIHTGQSIHDFGSGNTYANVRAWYLRCEQTTMDGNGGSMPLPTVADGGDLNVARILLFRPNTTLTGDPVDASATTQNNTYLPNVSFAAVTTTGTSRMIVLISSAILGAAQTQDTVVNVNLTGIAERADDTASGGGTFHSLAIATGLAASAGDIGASSATLSGNGVIATLTIALKP